MGLRLNLTASLLGTVALAALAGPGLAGEAGKPAALARQPLSQSVAPLLAKYCTDCHGGAKPKGGLALDGIHDESAISKQPKVWEEVLRRLKAHEMPPPKRPQLSPTEARQLTAWIKGRLTQLASARKNDPGRVTLHRLNRAEYNNTVRDLLGVSFQPADDFPADDIGYGFDNIGDVLSMPPLLLEKYLAAAEEIVDLAFRNPETRRRILDCQPPADNPCDRARRILEAFATRAYRRPVGAAEVDRLARLVQDAQKEGDGFEAALRLPLQAVLVSPHFLFRVELDHEPDNPAAVHPVTDFELASRLSYFLWSSMPDEELFALARQRRLRQDGNLQAQVRRMLKDSRSRALVDNFAGQWLQTRNLKALNPDPATFPGFDEPLREAMRRETELFFEAVLREDRSVLEFLDADFTFLNERLARHYGIAGVTGADFRRVSLAGSPRGGVLTQASVLTVTSNPTRTSPVKRGKWILENILGASIPPPPPGAGELSEDKAVVLSGSLRKRMEQHRANPACASCHQRMDPLGFGFENFDGVGAWRERDGKFPVDPSGVLPDGRSFQGPRELRAILKTQTAAFVHCLAEKMLTYALGRGLEAYDDAAVDGIGRALAADGYRFSRLVLEIVQSDPFQKRRGN
jgi:hypothetical protein